MGYEASAKYYDLFGEKPDLDYYISLGKIYKKALEIGVGTGRVALELAKKGVEVWGIDTSPSMLQVAKNKITKQPPEVQNRITLLQKDMTHFNLKETFSCIYIPASGLSHCISTSDQVNCLQCVHTHLEDDGLFAFDLVLPGTTYDNTLRLIDTKTTDQALICRWIANKVDSAEQILHTTLIFEVYKNQKLTERIIETSTVSLIYKRELLLLLEKCNFHVENIYGDFEKIESVTDQVVVEAKKVIQ
ncbi:MAG: class I SAM-dependent methyltransferase [Candidatus Methanofastidiosia archaeon]|jgi:SAM-dependent methyltransferase